MTFWNLFKFGSRSVVIDSLLLYFVLLTLLGIFSIICNGENSNRDPKKLFGGYRITPTYCKASREAKYNKGNTICMFNHECVQRGGEVVGACMDGFLFGACCQLKSDSQSHFPKGPGVVMTSYLDYPDAETTDDYETDDLNAWHDSFKPIVTPGYRPNDKVKIPITTEKFELNLSTESEIIAEGLTQITNSLLNSPPKEVIVQPDKNGIYSYSTIDHNLADTILLNENGSFYENIARPSDFNIQVSEMQTKPTVPPKPATTTTPKTVSTHKPMKPIFKPKPFNKTNTPSTSTDNYLLVSISSKDNHTEHSSITSIMQMLNESALNVKEESTTSTVGIVETKSSPSLTSTVSLTSYSTENPNNYLSTGHYVTFKPVEYASSSITPSSFLSYPSTKPTFSSKKPSYSDNVIIQEYKPYTEKPYSPSSQPSQSTLQAIETFSNYPVNPNEFGDSLTTFSYVSSSTTTVQPTITTRKPPSTSYVTGSSPLRRPITPPGFSSNTYDIASENFSSMTPTVIVLNSHPTSKPDTSTEELQPQFVEILQEPFKKPVSQITVNNHVESTNNIYVNKPAQGFKPSPPTVNTPTIVITPKPAQVTTLYPVKSTTSSSTLAVIYNAHTEYNLSSTSSTLRPEVQTTSPDDSINFPPVRNPLLNTTGSNLGIYNSSVSLSDNELEFIDDFDFTTPTWKEDEKLNDKMNLFVNKIVGSLQGTFQELHDIVILDKKPNSTLVKATTPNPVRKTTTTKKPLITTKKPLRLTTTTKKPLTVKTTRKPVKLTTPLRTTTPAPTTVVTTIAPSTTKKTTPTTKKPKPTKRTTTTTTQATSTVLSDESITTENYEENIDYSDKNLCGLRPMARNGRIVGGKNAAFGSWPWQVLVRESSWLGLFTKTKCGGVLLSSKYATTAAHCQPGFLGTLIAVFGEHDITGAHEPMKPTERNVRRVIVHREFDATTFENDLALLELESPVKFDPHIIPICLPPDDQDFTGRMATVTGWGRLTYSGQVPPLLQEVQVPVIENNVCQEMFRVAGHQKRILNSFLCAGYANGQKDACEGDSGGPLVVQREDGRWQLAGTVSHGIKCAAPYLPGVYMRITYYKPWLRTVAGLK